MEGTAILNLGGAGDGTGFKEWPGRRGCRAQYGLEPGLLHATIVPGSEGRSSWLVDGGRGTERLGGWFKAGMRRQPKSDRDCRG